MDHTECVPAVICTNSDGSDKLNQSPVNGAIPQQMFLQPLETRRNGSRGSGKSKLNPSTASLKIDFSVKPITCGFMEGDLHWESFFESLR